MIANPENHNSNDGDSVSTSADHEGSDDSTEDDERESISGDENGSILSDDSDTSEQDVMLEDFSDNDEDFPPSSRRNSIIIIALLMTLGGLVLNFSYVLVQLRSIADESDSYAPDAKENNERSIFQPKELHEQKQQKSVREKTGIYKFAGLHGNKYRGGGVLSDAMIEQYEADGVIVIRNLIPHQLLEQLDQASAILVNEHQEKEDGNKRKRSQQFHMVKNHAIFLGVPPTDNTSCAFSSDEEGVCATNNNDAEDTDEIMSAFRHLALYSKIPRVAASLLRLDELRVGGAEYLNLPRQLPDDPVRNHTVDDSINLRVCRDIFLTKDEDDYACGWHVDDTGFWPSVAEDPGVNAWIALDDMPYQWSRKKLPKHLESEHPQTATNHTAVATFALSLGSHRAPWRHEAYEVTGTPHTLPPEGFLSAEDMIKRRPGKGTCNIKTSAPHLYDELNANMIVYDLKKGDVIFHDRWLFHRTVTVAEYENKLKEELGESFQLERSNKIYRRYSIRYSPGDARVPPGYGVEPSVLYNADNANRTLNAITEIDGPWYPEAWPRREASETLVIDEIEGLAELVHEKMPQAEIARDERKKEIRMALKKKGH